MARDSIEELIKEKDLTKINDQDRVNIAAFATFQYLRTNQFRTICNAPISQTLNH